MIENATLEEGKEVNIVTYITEETRWDLIELLQEFKDFFAWSYQDMPGLSADIVPDQATENDKRTLRRMAGDYVLDGEILYKRRKDQVLLRCVDAVESNKILEEIHEGVYGMHANRFTMARKIMRFGPSTGTTPYSLVYGMKAILPIEFEIPSLRVLSELKLDKAEWIQSRYDQLNLIEKKRLKILPMQKDFKGKWMPNWERPYLVKNAFSRGALILTEKDGKSLPNPVNSDSVKKYFT
ncbi:uncharacterized protein LOC128285386 [Gossypium arboreum]|uniref:uncharacterized protein LOC128285386 n=1 Tax=Gossypium arboreum TaxID=29729 RepID=UPI0022F1CECF|nr:uncharacterized protein LOC128285386 [Gossypium arboreum]